MKKTCAGILFLLIFPVCLMAQDFVVQVNDLIDKGGTENCRKALDIAAKALAANPSGYNENWVMARANRAYGDYAKREGLPGWKDICKDYGKKGMQYAEKAMTIKPGGVEAPFWYGCSVGTYADGVSVLRALKEGLKGKTQSGFERAYALDKMYDKGGPMKALGRFWQVLPFPMKDKKKSLEYLKEYNKSFPDDVEGLVYLGQALVDNKQTDAARAVLKKAAASSDKFYSAEAKKMLSEL